MFFLSSNLYVWSDLLRKYAPDEPSTRLVDNDDLGGKCNTNHICHIWKRNTVKKNKCSVGNDIYKHLLFLILLSKRGLPSQKKKKTIRKKIPFAQQRTAMKLKIAVTVILIW